MRCPTLAELPAAPPGKIGWPWTQETPQNANAMSRRSSYPKVSIVTPSYNQGRFIEETIRTVLLQGYPNLEYIIIDGGSTDNTVEIIRRYEPWLAYWTSEPDKGQSNAINKGFRHSTGEIMAWLNSDDCYEPGTVWRVVKTFQKHRNYHIVCGYRTAVDAASQPLTRDVYLRPDKFSVSRICYVPQETVFWRRSLWERVGELDESYQFALDFEFWQRIVAAGYRFGLIPQFIGIFRRHECAKSQTQLDIRSLEVARIYEHYLHSSRPELEMYMEVGRSWWLRKAALDRLYQKGLFRFPRLFELAVTILSL